ncbi:MAG TPA: dethiobiotin synthase [Candidatus Baltobacteraceae bacterium]
MSLNDMARIYMTGTDTDVGKTRLTAAAAAALQARGERTTIVKLVQTGIGAGEPGDAQIAGLLAHCEALEFYRFPKPADPWTAAQAANAAPIEAHELASRLALVGGSIVVEGSGGAAVPLNERESLSDVARLADLRAIVVVGLRLGCISHTLLTLEYLRAREIPVVGAVLCERHLLTEPAYPGEVEAALRSFVPILGTLAFEPDALTSVKRAAAIFQTVDMG